MSAHPLQISDRLARKVAAAARRLKLSREQFLAEAVEARLREMGGAEAAPSLFDRSRDLCGSVRGGPRDLARNKAHLQGYGAWRR